MACGCGGNKEQVMTTQAPGSGPGVQLFNKAGIPSWMWVVLILLGIQFFFNWSQKR